MKTYTAPQVEVIATFEKATAGVWFGNYVDFNGNKAPFPIA